ncbi:glycosyltransferase [Methylobacterium sp. CM6246]
MPRFPSKLKRTWAKIADELVAAGQPKKQFDPDFYRKYFGDLSHLRGEKALRRHYYRHGRVEGRPGTPEELLKKLALKYGTPPAEFQPSEYRIANPDLRHLKENYELIAHYLQFGKIEGREYIHKDDVLENDYRLLALKAANSRRLPDTLEEFVRLHFISSISWTKLLNLSEFNLLNRGDLASPCLTKIEAICTFIEIGIERQFALSSKYKFDAQFYTTVTSLDIERPSATQLYAYWLNTGFGRGEAPNEAEYLNGIIGEDEFPICFNEFLYRKIVSTHISIPDGRANALRHFVEFGFGMGLQVVDGGSSGAAFMNVLARRYLLSNQLTLALKATDTAISMADHVSSVHHTRGDVLKAQGNMPDATKEFLIAAHLPNASIWSHIHAVEGLAFTLDLFDQTLREIEFSSAYCSSSYHWRNTSRRALSHLQNIKRNHYIEMYLRGRRAEADNEIQVDLDRLVKVLAKIRPFPAILPQRDVGPILIIANRDLAQCDHYRVIQKYNYLRLGGWEAEVYDQNHPDAYRPAIDRARAVIFYRTPSTPDIIHAILYARAIGLQTYYDIDDLIFDAELYPDTFASFQGQIDEETYASLQYGVPLFRYAMKLCDVGIASTPELAKYIRPLVRTGICHVLRNGLDYRNNAYIQHKPKRLSAAKLTFFYGSGTKAHNQDFNELAAPALAYILRKYADTRLMIVGHLKLVPELQSLGERVCQIPFSTDVSDYWEALSGADINLAPLNKSRTTDCKSEIKWLEAAMCGIPSVVSSTATYDDALRDGEDVLIARSPEGWAQALEYLVLHPEGRSQIGGKAKERAMADYSAAAGIEGLSSFLPLPNSLAYKEKSLHTVGRSSPAGPAEIVEPSASYHQARLRAHEQIFGRRIGSKQPSSAQNGRRHRVLVVNIYFPPHSIGGATRVVRDNVEYITSHYKHAFDLAVLASDVGSERPYETSIDSHDGTPVYRTAIERKHHMDWYGFDQKMSAPFQEVLDHFKPDLIHFHCVQGLTATPVEIAAELGIPYLVTLHDAWWISDFQFLIDADGQLRLPTTDLLASSSDVPIGRLASVARRRRLERLLSKAKMVLAVSNSFSEIYRNAGVEQTVAVPNGISKLRFLPHTMSTTGRVRLGHIGNRSAHKGATLLEAILRANDFRNLSLTMVDNRYDAGYTRSETWGTTPVEIIGPVAQERVTQLYAQLDVLLAPSLWPESFGLAVREAKAAGLWVVASSLGAVGEDIEEDVNGYVVDVSDVTPLRDILRRIDEDPDRYLVSPPATNVEPRWADDQGEDLVLIYRNILDAGADGRQLSAGEKSLAGMGPKQG